LKCVVLVLLVLGLAGCIRRYDDFGQGTKQDVADTTTDSMSPDALGDEAHVRADAHEEVGTKPAKLRHIGWFGPGGTAVDPAGVRSAGSLSSFGAGYGAR